VRPSGTFFTLCDDRKTRRSVASEPYSLDGVQRLAGRASFLGSSFTVD
jgi:hypothetical protein